MYRSLMGIYESYNDDEMTGLRKQNGHYQSVKQPELHNWINQLSSVATTWNGLRIANNPEYFPDNQLYCQLNKYRIGIVTDGTVEPSFGFTTKTAFSPNGDAYYLYPFTLSMSKMQSKFLETHSDPQFVPREDVGPIMGVPAAFGGMSRLEGIYGDLGFGREYYPGVCFENLIGVNRWGSSGYWSSHVISAPDMPKWFSSGSGINDQNVSSRVANELAAYGTTSSFPQSNQPYYLYDAYDSQLPREKDIHIISSYIVDFKYVSRPGFKAAYFTFRDLYNWTNYRFTEQRIDAFSDPTAIAQLEGGEYIPGIHGRAFSSMRQIPVDFDPVDGIIFKYTNKNGSDDYTDIHSWDVSN